MKASTTKSISQFFIELFSAARGVNLSTSDVLIEHFRKRKIKCLEYKRLTPSIMLVHAESKESFRSSIEHSTLERMQEE